MTDGGGAMSIIADDTGAVQRAWAPGIRVGRVLGASGLGVGSPPVPIRSTSEPSAPGLVA